MRTPRFVRPDTCPDGFWKCKDGLRCVSGDRLCDGSARCPGKSL